MNSPVEDRNKALSGFESISQHVQQYVQLESSVIAESAQKLKKAQAAARLTR